MGTKIFKVLLVGVKSRGSSPLAKYLLKRNCQCEFASSRQEAHSLLQSRPFDMVLSPMRLHDASLFPLIEMLEGADISLFYFCPVEVGTWWLPALRRGEKCLGSPAVRSCEFVSALDEAIAEVRLNGRLAEESAQPVVRELEASVLSFIQPKLSYSVMAHSGVATLAKQKAAG